MRLISEEIVLDEVEHKVKLDIDSLAGYRKIALRKSGNGWYMCQLVAILRTECKVSAHDFRLAGYSAEELYAGGYSQGQLQVGGFKECDWRTVIGKGIKQAILPETDANTFLIALREI